MEKKGAQFPPIALHLTPATKDPPLPSYRPAEEPHRQIGAQGDTNHLDNQPGVFASASAPLPL